MIGDIASPVHKEQGHPFFSQFLLRSKDIFQFARLPDGDGGRVFQEEKHICYLVVGSPAEKLCLQIMSLTVPY
jgi:hypothetical protein